MPTVVVLAATTANRLLIVFSLTVALVLVAATAARRAARRAAGAGIRRRAGALVALGPLLGLALAPSPATLTVVAAVGAVSLAGVGMALERRRTADRLTM